MKKLLLTFLLLILCSCSSNNGPDMIDELKGEYELLYSEAVNEEDSISKEDMELLKSLGYNITLAFYDDRTGELKIFDEIIELKYNPKTNTIESDDAVINFELNDNQLTLIQENETLYFIKTY